MATPTGIKFSPLHISPEQALELTKAVREQYGMRLRLLTKLEYILDQDDPNEVGYFFDDNDHYLAVEVTDESMAVQQAKDWDGISLEYVIRPVRDTLRQYYWRQDNNTRVVIDVETGVVSHVNEDLIAGFWLENFIIDFAMALDVEIACYGCCGDIKSPLDIHDMQEKLIDGKILEQHHTFVIVIKEKYLDTQHMKTVLDNDKIRLTRFEQKNGYHIISSLARKIKPFTPRKI